MKKEILKEGERGLLLAVLIGVLGYGIKVATKSPMADPLILAMVIGIMITTAIGKESKLRPGFALAPTIFIPIGVVFYGAKNLNFVQFAEVEPLLIVPLILIMLVYFGVILILGRLLKQKNQITYLTATGSAICGASAIAITSPAVAAEPDDTSISLLAVALSALCGLFILLPFLSILFDITDKTYGLLAGSVLQFTGFVKAACANMPPLKTEMPIKELTSLALSIKAVRYLGLLIAIPLFSSLARKRVYIPYFLWAFLGAGILGSWSYAAHEAFYTRTLMPVIGPIYDISWSIAMAAVGLNADVRQLFSNNGIKALIMAFAGFFAACATFFVGLNIIGLF